MIFIKTETGSQVFKDRSVRLTPRQRSAFILFDGQRSFDDVLNSGMGIEAEDVNQMVAMGLLSPHPALTLARAMIESTGLVGVGVHNGSGNATVLKADMPEGPDRLHQQRYMDAYPIATRLTASLGLRGFRLNLSVEASGSYQDLVALAPKIRAAVGTVKAEPLFDALGLA